jgi:Secretion system C-terminal sorting domain
MKLRPLFLLFCFFILFKIGHSQTQRKVALLNMNTYNLEANNSRFQTCVNLLKLAGVPFDTTSFIDTAINYPLILTGSRIIDTTLTIPQKMQLQNYVSSGGVIISSSLRDPTLYPLFGIDSADSDNNLYFINWDTTVAPQYFDLVNDSLEKTVALADTDQTNYYVRAYTLSTGQSLGNYEDGRCALVKNSFGLGKTYLFGPDFRDIILRSELNMDLEAQRTYSNGFEPAKDVFVFIVRNIIRNAIPNSVYKYTSPNNSSSVLLITHDVDSKTGIDSMHYFYEYEASIGINAHYNITTRYMADTWMSAYYVGTEPKFDSLLLFGQTMSSHSVGHFPDFNDDSIFHYGSLGNTMISYSPAYLSGNTLGGTVLGELEVSKDILESTYGVNIRSYRSGHLCFPDSLGMGLEETGYEFNSTNSANDVLTGFPYYNYNRKSFSGEPSKILEIPMTISDVFKDNPIADTNYFLKVTIWIEDIAKYDQNNSPVTLLIHPNRGYKLQAMKDLLDSLPANMKIYPFQMYGEYWRKRDSLIFHTDKSNDTLFVRMENEIDPRQSFVIDHGGLNAVRFYDMNGNELLFYSQPYSASQRLYYYQPWTIDVKESVPEAFSFEIYPNPTNNVIIVASDFKNKEAVLTVADLAGKIVYCNKVRSGIMKQIDFSNFADESGIFFVNIRSGNYSATKKVIYIKD